ncbi:major facilitator superfamily domain-containing protein [Phthorimaea operculella]|nr:major facilitator superfamily domain-containing protein [Phthorimaea operculella]
MTYNDDRLSGTGGGGEPDTSIHMNTTQPDNESGELLDVGDTRALDTFHEDAIGQAGCGMAQVRVVLASVLAVAGAALELSAVPFILPSAEIELCIQPPEKASLVLMSLTGGAVGALSWGMVCSRLGRRRALMSALAVNAVFGAVAAFMPTLGTFMMARKRALMSALAVNAVFGAVAAFMPTLGTFMMARFCSAIGSGGIVPCCVTYTSEMTTRAARHFALVVVLAGAGMGAIVAALLADAMLPQNGRLTLIEDKEHFSAWHRYLLLCILPILSALVLLVWTHESPRYLLDAGREVDALTTYQNIHSNNQIRILGSSRTNRAPHYHLGELTLPGKRHHPPHNSGIMMIWVSLFQLFSATYRRAILCTGGILLCHMAIQVYLSVYVPGTVARASGELYSSNVKTVRSEALSDIHHNETLENVQYYNVSFTHCTFRDMLISHVTFRNCSFVDVAFSNIQTSYTMFEGCLFVNTTIIDTDLEVGRELDPWCVLNGTVLRGLRALCAPRADLIEGLQPRAREQKYVSYAMLSAAALALLPQRLRPMLLLCGVSVLLTPGIFYARDETSLYVMEALYRAIAILIFFNAATSIVNTHPAQQRSTALGCILAVAYLGGALALTAGSGAPAATAACGALALASVVLAFTLTQR